MRCPNCGSRDNKVVDSRTNDNSNSIRRRRECLKCSNNTSLSRNVRFCPLMSVFVLFKAKKNRKYLE